eukprot:TRINITY_DN3767_c1_g2_i1.p1 TRINITY_DN3767_c1_g2~~TRINITY_DN3767_c1_g2_i1.p1  ORF type:complete len:594 (+),score=82.46 TRINITY_DN3767_c1_g2_i1:47-1828(+)
MNDRSSGRDVSLWKIGKNEGAHGGAGLTAVEWLGKKGLLACGDEDGKIGLWKMLDIMQEGVPQLATKGPNRHKELKDEKKEKLQQEIEKYQLQFSEAFSRTSSLSILKSKTRETLNSLATNANLKIKPNPTDEELITSILSAPESRPVRPEDICMHSFTDGNIRFTVTPATHETLQAVKQAGDAPDLRKSLSLTEPVTYKRLKCLSWSKEHIPRVKITSLSSSADGSTLFSGSLDCTIKIWKVANCLQLAKTILLQNPVYELSASPDGSSVACTDGGGALLLYTSIELEGQTLQGHKHCVMWNAPGVQSKKFSLSQTTSSKLGNRSHITRCTSVSISNNGGKIAGVVKSGHKTLLVVWTVADETVLFDKVLERMKTESLLEFAQGGEVRLGCKDSFIFEVTEQTTRQEGASRIPVTSMRVHPSEDFAVVGLTDASIGVIGINGTNRKPVEHSVNISSTTTVAVHPSGEYVVFGTGKGHLFLLHCNKVVWNLDWEKSEPEGLPGRGDTALLSQKFPTLTQFDSFELQTQNLDLHKFAADGSQLLATQDTFSEFPHSSSDTYGGIPSATTTPLIPNGKRPLENPEMPEPDAKKTV